MDRDFSLYVRLKAADGNGLVKCSTCGKLLPWKEITLGYCIGRAHQSVRWDERNAAPQCRRCNC